MDIPEGLVKELNGLGGTRRSGWPGGEKWEEYCKDRELALLALADWLEEEGDERAGGMRWIARTHQDEGRGRWGCQVWPEDGGVGSLGCWYRVWKEGKAVLEQLPEKIFSRLAAKRKWASGIVYLGYGSSKVIRPSFPMPKSRRGIVHLEYGSITEALLALAEVVDEEGGVR